MSLIGFSQLKAAAAATMTVLVVSAPALAQDGYRVVVNPMNPVSSLSKTQVSKLYLEKTPWDDGAAAAPVDLLPSSPVRDGFSRDVLGLAIPAAVDRMREASKTSGTNPPPALATDREVLAYVRLKPGAIGYVSTAADVSGVKVIAVGGKTEHVIAGGAPAAAPVPVGGRIAMPQRLVHAQPTYPVIAKQGKIEGTVEVSVVIDERGNVGKAEVVKSIPQLDRAAVDAVKKWKFAPTVVNGVAVPVTMVVHVTFAL
jgi:TonB family protein